MGKFTDTRVSIGQYLSSMSDGMSKQNQYIYLVKGISLHLDSIGFVLVSVR